MIQSDNGKKYCVCQNKYNSSVAEQQIEFVCLNEKRATLFLDLKNVFAEKNR